MWASDGTELFFTGRVGNEFKLLAVPVMPKGETLGFGRPAALLTYVAVDPAGGVVGYAFGSNVGTGFDVAPDAERFAVVRVAASGLRHEIVLVQNWFEEVQRLAPTKQ